MFWRVRVAYEWEYNFKPKELVRVKHEYKPFKAYRVPICASSEDGSIIQKFSNARFDYLKESCCASEEILTKLQNLCARTQIYDPMLNYQEKRIDDTEVKYILTTANSWKDGIRDFTLRIHKNHPNELISLCFPAEIKKIDDTIFEAHITNFKPKSELSITFMNIRAGQGPFEHPPIFSK